MGFTRYWEVKEPADPHMFKQATDDIAEMLKEEGVWGDSVVYDLDMVNLPPMVDEYEIWFNGVGDDGHETFIASSDPGTGFCKTARKPYDLYVAAALMLLKHHLGDVIEIDSDGGNNEEEAEALAFRYMSL